MPPEQTSVSAPQAAECAPPVASHAAHATAVLPPPPPPSRVSVLMTLAAPPSDTAQKPSDAAQRVPLHPSRVADALAATAISLVDVGACGLEHSTGVRIPPNRKVMPKPRTASSPVPISGQAPHDALRVPTAPAAAASAAAEPPVRQAPSATCEAVQSAPVSAVPALPHSTAGDDATMKATTAHAPPSANPARCQLTCNVPQCADQGADHPAASCPVAPSDHYNNAALGVDAERCVTAAVVDRVPLPPPPATTRDTTMYSPSQRRLRNALAAPLPRSVAGAGNSAHQLVPAPTPAPAPGLCSADAVERRVVPAVGQELNASGEVAQARALTEGGLRAPRPAHAQQQTVPSPPASFASPPGMRGVVQLSSLQALRVPTSGGSPSSPLPAVRSPHTPQLTSAASRATAAYSSLPAPLPPSTARVGMPGSQHEPDVSSSDGVAAPPRQQSMIGASSASAFVRRSTSAASTPSTGIPVPPLQFVAFNHGADAGSPSPVAEEGRSDAPLSAGAARSCTPVQEAATGVPLGSPRTPPTLPVHLVQRNALTPLSSLGAAFSRVGLR